MKRICLLMVLTIISGLLMAQSVSLQVCDEDSIPIAYVSIEFKNNVNSTDREGKILLPVGISDVILSHVSYISRPITISSLTKDSLVVVYLKRKEIALEELFVTAKNKSRTHHKTFKNINHRTFAFTLHLGIKIGFVIGGLNEKENCFLDGIEFKAIITTDQKKSLTEGLLEFKIFKISNGMVLPEPLN